VGETGPFSTNCTTSLLKVPDQTGPSKGKTDAGKEFRVRKIRASTGSELLADSAGRKGRES